MHTYSIDIEVKVQVCIYRTRVMGYCAEGVRVKGSGFRLRNLACDMDTDMRTV